MYTILFVNQQRMTKCISIVHDHMKIYNKKNVQSMHIFCFITVLKQYKDIESSKCQCKC